MEGKMRRTKESIRCAWCGLKIHAKETFFEAESGEFCSKGCAVKHEADKGFAEIVRGE